MTSQQAISTADLTDEQIERVLNSRGFQKMLAYQRLAEGIDVLREEDEIFDSMATSILKQHSTVKSEDSIREFFELFVQEVETFTEPLVATNGEADIEESDLEDLYVEEESDV